jgi:TatD DNase family protein
MSDDMVDCHCHIDQFPNPSAVAREAERRQIHTVAVTNLPSHYQLGCPHLKDFKYVHLALGMHPLAVKNRFSEIGLFQSLASGADFIGEVGLDFSPEGKASKTKQIECFRMVLTCVRDRQRFVTVHSRGAASEVLDFLDEFCVSPVIFHWFTDADAILRRAIEQGHFFSVNHAMTQSKSGRNIISQIPPERLLTETDGPHVRVGRSVARPVDVTTLNATLATILKLDAAKVDDFTTNNFKRILSTVRKNGIQ